MQRGLGRGLEALLPKTKPSHAQTAGPRGGEHKIPVEKIRPNPAQPRKHFNEAKLRELAASIKTHGLAQPILVSPDAAGEGYVIIVGERRWRAAKIAGLSEIPAVIRDAGHKDRLQLALVENIQRENLNPIEEAVAYKNLMKDFGHTQEEIARALGKDRSVIANSVRLLNLSPEIQTLIEDGTLSAGHGRSIAAVDDPHKQKELVKKIIDGNLSVRDAEMLAGEIRKSAAADGKKKKGGAAHSGTRNAELAHLENALEKIYGTKVRVTGTVKKGRIAIHYYSLEDLERLAKALKRNR